MLQSAQALIDHIITWGEITRFELFSIACAQDWITVFEKAGVLHAATPATWSLSPELYSLLREDSEKAIRTALFQVPEYRGYLISILAEGAHLQPNRDFLMRSRNGRAMSFCRFSHQ
jgi:hypothetical protein